MMLNSKSIFLEFSMILALGTLVTPARADGIFVGPEKYKKSGHIWFDVKAIDCDFGAGELDFHNLSQECHKISNVTITPEYQFDLNYWGTRTAPDQDYSKPVSSSEVILPTYFKDGRKKTSVLRGFTVDAGTLGSDTEVIGKEESLFHNGRTVTQFYAIKFKDQPSIIIHRSLEN